MIYAAQTARRKVAAVQRRFELPQALAEMRDRHDAWRFVREFAAVWATPITDIDGFSDDEIDRAERLVRVRLPAAVREAYRLFGKRTDLTSRNGNLRPPEQLDYDQDNAVRPVLYRP
jgi:hypothetical protein